MKTGDGNLYVDNSLSLIGRLFPPELFEMFIDVGHYVRELNAYKPLVDKISSLTVIIEGVLARWMLCLFSDEESYLHKLNRDDF